MPQSRFKLCKTVLQLKKTGLSTWNLIERSPKYTALAFPHPKILFVSQPWRPTFLKTSKKFFSYVATFISDWWDKSCCAKYFSKNGKIAYMGDSGRNLSFLFFNFLTYNSERKKLLLRKSLHLTVKFFTILQKNQKMLINYVNCLTHGNSPSDSGPWSF